MHDNIWMLNVLDRHVAWTLCPNKKGWHFFSRHNYRYKIHDKFARFNSPYHCLHFLIDMSLQTRFCRVRNIIICIFLSPRQRRSIPIIKSNENQRSSGLGIGFCSNVTSQFGLSGFPLLKTTESYIRNCDRPLYATDICFCVFGSSGCKLTFSRNSSWMALYMPDRFLDG